MKISLFQGILLGVFAVSGLIGLFVFSTYSGGNSAEEGIGAVTVWGVLPKSDVTTALDAIVVTDNSLKDVSYVEHSPAAIRNDLATAIATGKAPDLVLISQEELLSVAKFVQPIPSETISARTFADAFVGEAQLFGSGGGVYGIPFLIDPLVLFYNRTILSSSGIPKPPSTWEALTGLVPHVTAITPGGKISRSLIPLGTYDNIANARAILSALFLQTGTPLSVTSGFGNRSANLGNESSTASVAPPGQAVVRFYTQFADPTKVSYSWDASLPYSTQAFLAGDVGLYIGYASEARRLRQANPNLNFDVAMLPQPVSATVKTTYGRVYAFAVPTGAKNISGAYQTAALFSTAPKQQIASLATGLAPASLAVLGTLTGDPVLDVAYPSALYARGWLSPAAGDVDRVFSGMITNVTSGRLTIDAAITAAEQSMNALFR